MLTFSSSHFYQQLPLYFSLFLFYFILFNILYFLYFGGTDDRSRSRNDRTRPSDDRRCLLFSSRPYSFYGWPSVSECTFSSPLFLIFSYLSTFVFFRNSLIPFHLSITLSLSLMAPPTNKRQKQRASRPPIEPSVPLGDSERFSTN